MKKHAAENRYTSFESVPLLLKAGDIACMLGLSRIGVWNLLRSGQFPTVTIGSHVMVRREKLFEWLETRERKVR